MNGINKQTQFNIGYAIIALLGLLLVQYVASMANRVATIPYSQFQQLVRRTKSRPSASRTASSRAP